MSKAEHVVLTDCCTTCPDLCTEIKSTVTLYAVPVTVHLYKGMNTLCQRHFVCTALHQCIQEHLIANRKSWNTSNSHTTTDRKQPSMVPHCEMWHRTPLW